MAGANASLILCAVDPLWLNPNPKQTIEQLKTIGLCADNISDQAWHFYAGDRFFDYITFMGCAPNINFSAQQPDDVFTHIRILHSPDRQLFRSGSLTRPPRCLHCAKTISDWRQKNIHETWQCPHCTKPSQPYEYDWRQSAGFGHFFIDITDVYPKEAIPQPALLDKLQQWHGVKWRYFYC